MAGRAGHLLGDQHPAGHPHERPDAGDRRGGEAGPLTPASGRADTSFAGDERAATVALARDWRRPAHHLAEAIEDAGSAITVLRSLPETGAEDASTGQGRLQPRAPADEPGALLTRAADNLARWERDGIRVVGVLDPDYPANLRAVHDRPALLFVRGELRPGDARAVAVIGSRAASRDGLRQAGVISAHLQAMEYVVTSGMAAGVDTAAHVAALKAGGRTVAVVGTGLNHVHPAENRELQAAIVRSGSVISQLWPEHPGSRESFPIRNALMSGISLANVIVEAGPRSGTRIQARAALAQTRPVFVWEGVVRQQWARTLAERPGVHVFSGPEEITEWLTRTADPTVIDRRHP